MTPDQIEHQVAIFGAWIAAIVAQYDACGVERHVALDQLRAGLEDALHHAGPRDDLQQLTRAVRLACARAGLSPDEVAAVVPVIN
jgi:hypothetical protein